MKKKLTRFSQNKTSIELHRTPRWIEISIQVVIVFVIIGAAQPKKNLSIFVGVVVVAAKSNCFDHFFVFMMGICQPFHFVFVSTWAEFILFGVFVCSIFSPEQGAPNGNEKSKKLFFFFSFSLLLDTCTQTSKHRAASNSTLNSIVDFLDLLAVQVRIWFRAVYFSLLFFARFHWMAIYLPVGTFLLLLLIISLSKLKVVCVEKRAKKKFPSNIACTFG